MTRQSICYNPRNNESMPSFRLGWDLFENIEQLRVALGSATRPLSRRDLALMLSERHPEKRQISESAVRWWGQRKGEPDVLTIDVMAELAGVSFEQFALGRRGRISVRDEPTLRGAETEPVVVPDASIETHRHKRTR